MGCRRLCLRMHLCVRSKCEWEAWTTWRPHQDCSQPSRNSLHLRLERYKIKTTRVLAVEYHGSAVLFNSSCSDSPGRNTALYSPSLRWRQKGKGRLLSREEYAEISHSPSPLLASSGLFIIIFFLLTRVGWKTRRQLRRRRR
jgi:hypothetical protein